MALIDDVKDYLRVDADLGDDIQISSLINAAITYGQNLTGKQYIASDNSADLWNVLIKLLVAHWYNMRTINPTKPGTLSEYPHSVTALLNHISLCSQYPNLSSTDTTSGGTV